MAQKTIEFTAPDISATLNGKWQGEPHNASGDIIFKTTKPNGKIVKVWLTFTRAEADGGNSIQCYINNQGVNNISELDLNGAIVDSIPYRLEDSAIFGTHTVTISNIVQHVTYEEVAPTGINNIIIGDTKITKVFLGDIPITNAYIGNTKIYSK